MLRPAKNDYDYVLVDLPPILPVVDVKAAAHLFDAFVLVVEWGSTSTDEIVKAVAASPILCRSGCWARFSTRPTRPSCAASRVIRIGVTIITQTKKSPAETSSFAYRASPRSSLGFRAPGFPSDRSPFAA